ncbi:MAG: TonB-dependent receptor [Opitutus sp.]|nr:TonB-dependent receptor [Opitutus sp.]
MKAFPPPLSAVRSLLISLSVALAASPGLGASLDPATITGQVSNAATRAYLEGAAVSLANSGQSAFTDREGRYQLGGVPPGAVTLVVSFSGLDPQQVSVVAGAGQRLVRDIALTAEIYRLDKFVVAGEREGTARAETLQRQAPNVKNIVSSDTFGNVADGNIGDLLQHIAGITANYTGPDVRTVSIRGVGPDLNSVTMDGQQMASAKSAEPGRDFEYEQASLANIETIEVTKAPTPDMDGASIGGSVNLVSKSAFDRATGRVFTYGIGFTTQLVFTGPANKWKQPIKGIGPSLNFMYSDVLGVNRNIGITLSAVAHSMPSGSARTISNLEEKNEPGPVYASSATKVMLMATRSRLATGLKLDYKLSERSTVSVNTSYNFFYEDNDSRTFTLIASKALATVDANGNRTGGGFINPNYTNGITRVYAGTSSTATLNHGATAKWGRTYLVQPMARHRFDGLSIDYSLSYSNALSYNPPGVTHGPFGRLSPLGAVSARLANIGWTVDRSGDPTWPTTKQTEGPDMYNLNNYNTLLLTQNDASGVDKVLGAKFDLKKNIALAVPTFAKTGFTVQRQSRRFGNENRRYNFAGPDGTLGNADDSRDYAQFADIPHLATDDEIKYFRNRGGIPPWMNPYNVARHQQYSPQSWKEDIAFGTMNRLLFREITETIAAAYLMGNVRFGKISVLSGVRLENTHDEGTGPLNYISPAEKARRAAFAGVAPDAELVRRAEAQYGTRATNHGNYTVVLPGVHLKYEPFGGLVTRLSWSTGVGRPAFGSIIPNNTVNDDTRAVTVSNPELKPQYANSYDLTAEYYFKSQGMFSLGVFRKKIADYIFTDTSRTVGSGAENGFDGDYVGYRITTQANGGFARIEGLEASYQQQLTFLPGWSKGFGLYGNYTALRTEGDYGGAAVLTSRNLPNFMKNSGNIGLSYRGFGLDLRLQAVFRGKYMTTNSATPALVAFQKAKTTWNWKSRYALTKRVGLFLDVENIFSVPLDTVYLLYEDRISINRNFHAKIVGGFNGRF